MNDAATLKNRLKIDKSSLDREVTEQPMLFFSVAELYEEAAAERDMLKEELATVDAELDGVIRAKLGDKKVTEAVVKNGVQLNPKHEKAFQAYLEAKTKAGRLASMKDSFQQRGYMLRDLASLYVASYFEQSSVQGTNNTDTARYNSHRERLAQARREKGSD